MKKINIEIKGPLLTLSGYGVHSRQVARWGLSLPQEFFNVSFIITNWGNTPWLLSDNGDTGTLVSDICARTKPVATGTSLNDISIQIDLPDKWTRIGHETIIGVTAGVETDVVNPDWITHMKNIGLNHLVVPSQHTKNSFMNTEKCFCEGDKPGYIPISVIPESYFDLIFKNEQKDHINVFENSFPKPFNFLVFGQLTGTNPLNDRKNTFYLLKWLCEEFKDDPNVGIVIKTNTGNNSVRDRVTTTSLIKRVISECRPNSQTPNISLLHGTLSEREIIDLYKCSSIKAIVSATRGEGYGLPLLEAASCNLPVIATGWSGHLDFLNEGRWIKLDYQIKEIHQSRIDNQVFVNGSKWAEVDEGDLKEKLRKFYKSPEKPSQWAQSLGEKVRENYSFSKIKDQYDKIIGQYFKV